MRHVVFVGPQGAGKGTQAARVAPTFSLVHLSTGDIFRDVMATDSPLAAELRSYVDKGELVPDALTARLLFTALDEHAAGGTSAGALFDGFPRNAAQAEVLDAAVAGRGESLASIIHIAVPRDVLLTRLTGRLTCRTCGRTFHREFNPPRVSGVCDHDGGELYTRTDDTVEAVERRLAIYFSQTEPLLDHWRPRGIVRDINGNQEIDAVTTDIVDTLAFDYETPEATA